jgi:hypothetical protein
MSATTLRPTKALLAALLAMAGLMLHAALAGAAGGICLCDVTPSRGTACGNHETPGCCGHARAGGGAVEATGTTLGPVCPCRADGDGSRAPQSCPCQIRLPSEASELNLGRRATIEPPTVPTAFSLIAPDRLDDSGYRLLQRNSASGPDAPGPLQPLLCVWRN